MSVTVPMPSHRGHMPPVMENVALATLAVPRSTLIVPPPRADATLNEKACGDPMCGVPRRLNRIRSNALASVAVPTVDRTFAPIRSWSTRIAVVSPSRTSTSGRASVGMNPCTNALYVSLISRCDSAAIVPNTSELLPEPETPVNTVSRRFGMTTLTSLRLFTRAPWTRIRSWVSATGVEGGESVVWARRIGVLIARGWRVAGGDNLPQVGGRAGHRRRLPGAPARRPIATSQRPGERVPVRRQRWRDLDGARDVDAPPAVGGLERRDHRVEDVERERARRPLRPVPADRARQLEDPDATTHRGLGERDGLDARTRVDDELAAERVRVRRHEDGLGRRHLELVSTDGGVEREDARRGRAPGELVQGGDVGWDPDRKRLAGPRA